MAAQRSDVLVLGGGVIGLACALRLLQAGASVRIVEQGTVGSGASHGNCGTLTPSHAIPLLTPGGLRKAFAQMLQNDAPLHIHPRPELARFLWLLRLARQGRRARAEEAAEARATLLLSSIDLMRDWIEEEGLDCEYAARGTLYVYRHAESLREAEKHAQWLDRLGIEAQRKSDDELQAMEPALKPGMAGGYFHPGDAHLRPEAFVAELARRVRELGGIVEENARIERVHVNGRQIDAVRTHRGVYSGKRMVMALGAWSPQVGRMFGMRLPMQPGKGYSITWSRPSRAPSRPLMLREDGVCAVAWGSGFRLGGTMEFNGFDGLLNDARVKAIRRAATHYLHESSGPVLQEMWWGWRPMSVDQLPIIGESRRWSNLIFATAHGMLGMSMAAGTAEIVTALCRGVAPDIDTHAFRPARFRL
ncbi:NAD(P)/FAD-dependent oxidoreductase [Oleiagrimonas soli]|uniref:Amino acid dehydrogenase n=1 Tax=Oleiagrimonas soli TaxID=1543381 RepID=A0A099CUM5_9GAMM|nr:FAD-dependent oxidoreductase [Oleiagrimonas soli]KGI77628.1 amino acid dehydrogenase [Oleiagrimonas soli]MBB6182873.1 D-amino-acid dehydrogenase [Oleiagrimonas soli]